MKLLVVFLMLLEAMPTNGQAADPPTGLAGPQTGTTIRVYWTPPTSGPTPTGYRISYYQAEDDPGSAQTVDVDSGTTTSHDLTGVQDGVSYNISIQTLSGAASPSEVVTVLSRTAPVVMMGDQTIPNHGMVDRDSIGEDPVNILQCLTNNLDCCVARSDSGAFWYHPGGAEVGSQGNPTNLYYRTRGGPGFGVNLHRRTTGTEEGVFRCQIPDGAGTASSYYVGVYTSGEGAVTIQSLNFTVLTEDPPSFVLTCTTVGGPASSVTWTRNGWMVTEDSDHVILQSVTNGVSAEYNNSLSVSVAEYGTYRCTVSNARTPTPVSQEIEVEGDGVLSLELTTAGSQTAGSTEYAITCTVTLTEPLGTPSITWMAPGDTLISTGSDFTVGAVTGSGTTYSTALMFNTLKTSLAGEYTCNATLGSETTVSTTSVSVTIPTPSMDITPDPDRTLYNGEDVTLTCTITLDPAVDSGVAATASWTGPGGFITTGVVDMTDAVSYQSTLTLSSLNTSDTGDYICTASVDPNDPTYITGSEDGSDMLDITVEDYTVSITASGTPALGQTYFLLCTVEGVSDSPTIQWFGPDGSEITTSVSTTTSPSTLTLSDLSLSDAGEYTCRSTLSGVEREDMEEVNLQVLPDVSARNDGSDTIYAGSVLTMTCDVSLPSSVQDIISDFSVTISWTGASNGAVSGDSRITVQPADPVFTGSRFFESTVEFNTLRTSDSDTYTCTATVTPSGSQPFLAQGQASDTTTITVVNPTIAVTVEANTTRLPTEPPYNTFTILCTASVPDGVIAAKSFTWRRRTGSEDTGLDVITDGGDFAIESSDLTEAVSTSRLTVTEDTAGDYRYRCRADIDDLDIDDLDIREREDVYPIDVIGEAAPSFTGLTATSDLYDRATIQWTVPVIAYTPETYVVNYGTDMGTLDRESETLPSGIDFEATSLKFSVQLTGLTADTVYYYQLVVTNIFTSTSSDIMSFTTPEKAPDPPLNFQVTAVDTDTLQFSWDPPNFTTGEPNSYSLSCVSTFPPQLQQTFSKDYIVDDSNQTMSINDTVSEFSPGVIYRCSVVSSNSAGPGQSVTQYVSTLPDYPDGPPQSFEISADGPRNLTFSWTEVAPELRNGNITSYTLTCDPTVQSVLPVSTMDLSNSLDGFTPYTNYTCEVVGSNSAGDSPPANDSILMPEDAPGGPPLNIAFTANTPDRVLFSWNPPTAPNGILTYSIECTSDGDGVSTQATAMTMEQSVSVTGLSPAAEYNCTFTASTTAGNGPSDTITVVSLPEAPTITNVTAVSSTHLRVTYDPPLRSDLVTMYTVYLNRSKRGLGEESYQTVGAELSLEVGPLLPYEEVIVQVSATTAGGEGPRSDELRGRTNEDNPGPVANVRWLPQGESTVKIEWEDPTAPNGVITRFIVKLLRYNDGAGIDSETIDVGNDAVIFSDAQIMAGVPYNYSVVAVNSAGEGQEMVFTSFTEVLPAPPPGNVQVQRSGREMTVSWTRLTLVEAHGFVQFYLITIQIGQSSTKRQEGGGYDISSITLRASAASDSLTVTGLDPNTAYGVTVAAANGLQEPPSDPEEVDEASVTVGDTRVEQRVEGTDSGGGGGGGGDIGIIIGVFVVGIIIGAVAVGIVITGIFIYRRRHAELTTTECAAYGMATTSLPLQDLTTDLSQDYEVITAGNPAYVPTWRRASTEQNMDMDDGVHENDDAYEVIPQ